MNSIVCLVLATAGIMSFKDAGKIKSWDAWHVHEKQPVITNILQKEKRCVTIEKLRRLDPGLREIGLLKTRTTAEVRSSKFSIDCGALDRDYADWNSYKALIPMLGVKHARFFSGWAKTEQEKGVYDFSWQDRPLRECAAMGIRPWVTVCYGNPLYGSDFRLGMRLRQLTGNAEAMSAWLRFVRAFVTRYGDIVNEWEIWNEPFGQGDEYAILFYETAKAIREIQPTAKLISAAILCPEDTVKLLDKLKAESALGLIDYLNAHPYHSNPDQDYDAYLNEHREVASRYAPHIGLIQGECGCPGQLEFAHAMNSIEWTEYSQAKWDLRRAVGDAARGVPSHCFSMTDLQYTFMLQSYGLVRSNTLKEFVYRRPKWFAMRNVYALLDDDVKPVSVTIDGPLTKAVVERDGARLAFYWFSDKVPTSELAFEPVRLEHGFRDPVWVEMITGRVFELGNAKFVPLWDAPVLIAERSSVPLSSEPRPKFGPIPLPALKPCGTAGGHTDADGRVKATTYVRAFTVDGKKVELGSGEMRIDLTKIYPGEAVKGKCGSRWAEVEFVYTADAAGYQTFGIENDYFGELFLDGEPVCAPNGSCEVPLKLKSGENRICLRTRCGIAGLWYVGFRLP